MTSRPRYVVPISIWFGLNLAFFIVNPSDRVLARHGINQSVRSFIVVMELALIIVFCARLAQLRVSYIRVGTAIVGLGSGSMIFNVVTGAVPGFFAYHVAMVLTAIFLLLNVASIRYLMRPRFLALAREYRMERDLSQETRRAERAIKR